MTRSGPRGNADSADYGLLLRELAHLHWGGRLKFDGIETYAPYITAVQRPVLSWSAWVTCGVKP